MLHLPLPIAIIYVALPGLLAAAKCRQSQYQVSSIVLNCNGAVGTVAVGLHEAQASSIASFPEGARDVEIAVSADVDFDMQLVDSSLGKCITGFNCLHDKACADEDDYCISYERMPVYYSGDDKSAPVQEKIKIRGVLTRAMDFLVFAQAVGTGTVTYSYSALSFCSDPLPGCASCKYYSGCWNKADPVCNGTPEVGCGPASPPPSASTSTPNARLRSSARAPSAGSVKFAQPAPIWAPTRRPNFKHGFHEMVRNVSAGTAMVGGIIQHKINTTLNKIDTKVVKIDQNMHNGFNDLNQKVNNGITTVKGSFTRMGQKMAHDLNKANQTLQKISRGMLSTLAPVALPTLPPTKLSPDWKSLLLSKEQATNDTPASRSEEEVPSALGPWLLSFFYSWSSPGSVCAVALLTMVFVLLSATSFRCCMLARGYAHVLPRPGPAPPVQSRDVFLARGEADNATPAPSRMLLLQPEVDPADVE